MQKLISILTLVLLLLPAFCFADYQSQPILDLNSGEIVGIVNPDGTVIDPRDGDIKGVIEDDAMIDFDTGDVHPVTPGGVILDDEW